MKTYCVRFAVIGSGVFPLDMLRYDRCYPQTERDANVAQGHSLIAEARVVNLESPGNQRHWQPCAARWRSFGWEVMEPLYYTLDRRFRVCLMQSGLYHIQGRCGRAWEFVCVYLDDSVAFTRANEHARPAPVVSP